MTKTLWIVSQIEAYTGSPSIMAVCDTEELAEIFQKEIYKTFPKYEDDQIQIEEIELNIRKKSIYEGGD